MDDSVSIRNHSLKKEENKEEEGFINTLKYEWVCEHVIVLDVCYTIKRWSMNGCVNMLLYWMYVIRLNVEVWMGVWTCYCIGCMLYD